MNIFMNAQDCEFNYLLALFEYQLKLSPWDWNSTHLNWMLVLGFIPALGSVVFYSVLGGCHHHFLDHELAHRVCCSLILCIPQERIIIGVEEGLLLRIL